jgi:hypothetical protein
MYIENLGSITESVNTAMNLATNVLYSLVPAFAVGFAVQRLLEIISSWSDLIKKITPEYKRALLLLFSWVVGSFLAWRLGIRILLALVCPEFCEEGKTKSESILGSLSPSVDYILSGLIISAGTEGFNSILKFLSYSKDVTKTQAESERTTAISDRVINRLKTSTFTTSSSNMSSIASALEGTIKEELKAALAERVKNDITNQFNPANWSETKFDVLYQKLPAHLRLHGVSNVLKESFTPVLDDWGVPLTPERWKLYLQGITLASTPDFAIELIGTI